jgi:tRNA1Val (adenine37-N6)-methyltransferase
MDRREELEAELGEKITLDGLSATFKIFQRRNGHRHSTDDLMTAWYALEQLQPDRALDLGTGIGTVGLLMVSALPALRLTCIEAQDISFRFLRENIAINQVGDRVRPIHGDLREPFLDEKFPLVTGSPPYFDPKAGIVPADSQKAHARFELRGDVTDYVRAAQAHLEPGGLFVFCFPFAQADRAVAGVHAEGFSIVTRRDVVPREGLTPLFGLFACRYGTCHEAIEPPFVVRDAGGEHTPMYRAVRRRFGWE